MSVPRIVRGQSVDEVKAKRAKQFRREMTPEETILWVCLRGNRLHGLHFRRQQVIHGFIADFYCHKAKIIVEVDGSAHDGREEYDAERNSLLANYGFVTVRFPNQSVREDIDNVLNTIAQIALTRQSEDSR